MSFGIFFCFSIINTVRENKIFMRLCRVCLKINYSHCDGYEMNAVMKNLIHVTIILQLSKIQYLKFMIHLINNIRCAARMEMKCTHKKGRGLGAAARPQVDPGQSPGWGLGGQSCRKLLCFLYFFFNFLQKKSCYLPFLQQTRSTEKSFTGLYNTTMESFKYQYRYYQGIFSKYIIILYLVL